VGKKKAPAKLEGRFEKPFKLASTSKKKVPERKSREKREKKSPLKNGSVAFTREPPLKARVWLSEGGGVLGGKVRWEVGGGVRRGWWFRARKKKRNNFARGGTRCSLITATPKKKKTVPGKARGKCSPEKEESTVNSQQRRLKKKN